jgi:hypothetical protein
MAKNNKDNFSFALIAIVGVVAIVGLVVIFMNMNVGTTQYTPVLRSSASSNIEGAATAGASSNMPQNAGVSDCKAKCGENGGGLATTVKNGVTTKNCYCY